MNDCPPCGSNGPAMPLWYSADGVLSNCGNESFGSVTLRKSPVAINDESVTWLLAPFAPFSPQVRPESGSVSPAMSNGFRVTGAKPPPGVVIPAPTVYSIGSPCEAPDPESGRQRACTAGSARH